MRSRVPGFVDETFQRAVAWRVHRTAGSVTGPATILQNVVSIDTHSCYSSATGLYTVKIPGLNSISALEFSRDDGSIGTLYFDINVNGISLVRTIQVKTTAGNGVTATASVEALLNVGDTMSIFNNAYPTYGLHSTTSLFTGYLLGPP